MEIPRFIPRGTESESAIVCFVGSRPRVLEGGLRRSLAPVGFGYGAGSWASRSRSSTTSSLDDGAPHLVAWEAVDSGALYFDRRNADAKGGGTEFRRTQARRPPGKVRSFTIVHRAVPGVPAPYVSAIVDLDGGGVVKANILNVAPDPEHVQLGMPVRLTTFVAGTDDDGTEAIAFAFEPRRAERGH